jgi:hypothetical protein
LGHYIVDLIADKPGYDSDSLGLGFDVVPQLSITASANRDSFSVYDTVKISAIVKERDSLLTKGVVSGEAMNPHDTLLFSSIFDSLSNKYRSDLVLSTLLGTDPTPPIPGDHWEIGITAQYFGVSAVDTLSIDVHVPDLSITSSDLSFDVTNPQEGDLVAIFSKIHNTGSFISDSCQISFYYDFINNNRRIGPVCPIPPVPPGDSITICVMWNTFGYGGEGTIYAVIDPDSTTVQSSRANDIASHSITVGQLYLRGDANNDQVINSADVVYLINYLFINGPEPKPFLWIGDVNWDGNVNVADVVYLINYLFIGGPPPCEP